MAKEGVVLVLTYCALHLVADTLGEWSMAGTTAEESTVAATNFAKAQHAPLPGNNHHSGAGSSSIDPPMYSNVSHSHLGTISHCLVPPQVNWRPPFFSMPLEHRRR
jgi:hypothetical protein